MTNNNEEVKSLKAEIENLKKLAYKDELTGLYNRHGFKDGAERFISELASENGDGRKREAVYIKSFSLIMFDIDDFKKLNDTYGHRAGDAVLKMFAKIVMDNVRDIDSASRWGGEEIVLGLVGASEEDAFRIADRIRDRVEKETIEFEGNKIKFRVSGGVASMDDAKDFDEMLGCADKALYKAKSAGKNQVVKYSELKK